MGDTGVGRAAVSGGDRATAVVATAEDEIVDSVNDDEIEPTDGGTSDPHVET